MSTFTGGALKLKGGVAPIKSKKKKKKSNQIILKADSEAERAHEQGKEDGKAASSSGGPPVPEDRRTEAEKKAENHMLKYEEARLRKAAAKSHRERVTEMNQKLANMTEVRQCDHMHRVLVGGAECYNLGDRYGADLCFWCGLCVDDVSCSSTSRSNGLHLLPLLCCCSTMTSSV